MEAIAPEFESGNGVGLNPNWYKLESRTA